MAQPEAQGASSARVQITVALIGLAGVIATAVIANWGHMFPRHSSVPPSATSVASGSSSLSNGKAERPIHSSGRLVVRGTYAYDLDKGLETSAGADFQWEIVDNTRRNLLPLNGASFCVVGAREFESIRWSEMEHFHYSADKIRADNDNSNRIPARTVVAFRTNEGRLGKLIVDDYGYNLAIRWRTYD